MSFDGFTERRSVLAGLKSQTEFNGIGDPTTKVSRNVRYVALLADSEVVA